MVEMASVHVGKVLEGRKLKGRIDVFEWEVKLSIPPPDPHSAWIVKLERGNRQCGRGGVLVPVHREMQSLQVIRKKTQNPRNDCVNIAVLVAEPLKTGRLDVRSQGRRLCDGLKKERKLKYLQDPPKAGLQVECAINRYKVRTSWIMIIVEIGTAVYHGGDMAVEGFRSQCQGEERIVRGVACNDEVELLGKRSKSSHGEFNGVHRLEKRRLSSDMDAVLMRGR
jgi:hypothetical protein